MDLENGGEILPSIENPLPGGEYTLPDSVTYTLAGLHIIIVVVAITGNVSLVALFHLKQRLHRTNANCYLTAIAISDILLVMWCEPFTIFSNLINFHWMFGQFLCSAVSFLQTSCVIQRSFTLVASCIDRYHAICWPLKKQTSRLIVISIIIAIWFVSLVLPVPIAIFAQIVFYEYGNVSAWSACLEVWPNEDFRRAFSIILLLLTYALPLLVLAVTYRKIVLILQAKPPGEEYEILVRKRRNMKRKTIQIFLLAFSAYAVCWLPIHVITIIGDITPEIYDNKVVHVVWLFAQCLAVSNSAVSPIIVLVREKKLRSQLLDRVNSVRTQRRESGLSRQNSFLFRVQQMKRDSSQHTFLSLTSTESNSHRRRRSSSLSALRRESELIRQRPKLRRSSTQETCV